MRLDNPGVTLSAVQLTVAREYGFSSWRSLIAFVKAQSDREARLLEQKRAARAKFQDFSDGVEAAGRGDFQTAVAHLRQAEATHLTITLSHVKHAVTKEFGESVWLDLFAYIKLLPAKGPLRRGKKMCLMHSMTDWRRRKRKLSNCCGAFPPGSQRTTHEDPGALLFGASAHSPTDVSQSARCFRGIAQTRF